MGESEVERSIERGRETTRGWITSRCTRTQRHPWFRRAVVQVYGLAPFTGSCAGPAPVSLSVK
jgi:hypothetical protein